jgi:hypothetical protein
MSAIDQSGRHCQLRARPTNKRPKVEPMFWSNQQLQITLVGAALADYSKKFSSRVLKAF